MTTARSSPPEAEAEGERTPLARLVELACAVPVEVGGRLIDAVPSVVEQVPSAAERVKREIVLARFLGKMVVDQGVRELRTRLAPHDDEPATTPEAPVAPAAAPAVQRAAPVGADALAVDDDDAPDVSSLALADYDHLSSAQIVGKLDGLDAAERRAIERYERAGRCRRTILGKLAQLEAHE
jgi:hypothetical protein